MYIKYMKFMFLLILKFKNFIFIKYNGYFNIKKYLFGYRRIQEIIVPYIAL